MQTIATSSQSGVKIHLFIRKNKLDNTSSQEFYYLGEMKYDNQMTEFTMPGVEKPAVKIKYHLDTPVENNLYEYITEQSL